VTRKGRYGDAAERQCSIWHTTIDDESQVAFPAFITAQGETVGTLGSTSLDELKVSSDIIYVAGKH
jgi:hypothetical protein